MIVLVSLYLNILFNYSFTNLEFLHPLQSFILDKRRNNPKISNLKCNFMNLDHILKIKFSSKKRNGCIHTRYAQWLTLRLYMKAWCMLCLTQICLTQICPPPTRTHSTIQIYGIPETLVFLGGHNQYIRESDMEYTVKTKCSKTMNLFQEAFTSESFYLRANQVPSKQ